MKSVLILLIAWVAVQAAQAQGTVYLSNVGQPSSFSQGVGSDSWVAEGAFHTGLNPEGYLLNTIQLSMNNAVGTANRFQMMLYSAAFTGGPIPGAKILSLTGPSNPSTAGIYSYDAGSFPLSPDTFYFITATAGTPAATGSYEWNFSNVYYETPEHWGGLNGAFGSGDGLSWTHLFSSGYSQYAVNATPVPEPAISCLFVLGGVLLMWLRRKGG